MGNKEILGSVMFGGRDKLTSHPGTCYDSLGHAPKSGALSGHRIMLRNTVVAIQVIHHTEDDSDYAGSKYLLRG